MHVVLIRILALLQRKTLLETRNRTFKCFTKTALFDCVINEKCCSVDGGRGICQFKSPFKAKKKANAWGSEGEGGGRGGRWTQLELTDALNFLAHPNNA